MSLPETIIRQLGHPTGLLGRIMLTMLNRANDGMNQVTLDALALTGGDRMLEIGFGGGGLLARALANEANCTVTGTDISSLVIQRAERRFRRPVQSGRLSLKRGSGHQMPFDAGTFTKVCCVNVIYFWDDIPGALAEIHRVLADGGLFVLCYNNTPPNKDGVFTPDTVTPLLSAAGFTSISSRQYFEKHQGRYYCTQAMKPGVSARTR